MDCLSAHDKAVVKTILDPFHLIPDEKSPNQFEDDIQENEDEPLLKNEEVKRIVNEAIKCVEDQEFERAFELFAKALNKIPNSAAILNDRAQALRLVFRDQEALDDLNLAIQLSGGRGKTAVKALCQRALLYRQLGREQEAIQDFENAAKSGSQFAKSQLVALNPYAALCNSMLQQLFLPTNSS